MEPHEVDLIIRHLAATLAKQDVVNDDLRTCLQEQQAFNRQQGAINERLTSAIERLDVTQARIETLLSRIIPTGANGTDA